jgi:hypothetical protein
MLSVDGIDIGDIGRTAKLFLSCFAGCPALANRWWGNFTSFRRIRALNHRFTQPPIVFSRNSSTSLSHYHSLQDTHPSAFYALPHLDLLLVPLSRGMQHHVILPA